MMKIDAKYFDGISSKEHIVVLEFSENKYLTIYPYGIELPLDEIMIRSRLGNTPRVIELPNGAKCKIEDNDLLDDILEKLQIKNPPIHKLESSWKLALGSVVLIVLLSVFFLTVGADYSAEVISKILPANTLDYAGQQALKELDSKYLQESNISTAKRQKILDLFSKLVQGDDRYKLHFRSSKIMGPNAFALPSGDVIILDKLIELDKDKDLRGILGVLAHEKGHIVYRHTLKGIIKGSVASAVIGYVTGDISFIVTAVPMVLISTGYTREYEQQADNFAKAELDRLHISSKPLARLFKEMEQYIQKRYKDSGKTPSWLSTHPVTKDRIKFFNKE